MTATVAGVVAASFAFVNLGARPLGGYLSDRMSNRKRTMLIYMVGIAVGFFLMALIGRWGGGVDADGLRTVVPMFGGVAWLAVAVAITIFASVFVQGAEGATFAIIPMINKRMTGQIAGMAGAYGNVGAVVYLVVVLTGRRQDLLLHPGRRRSTQFHCDVLHARGTRRLLRRSLRPRYGRTCGGLDVNQPGGRKHPRPGRGTHG